MHNTPTIFVVNSNALGDVAASLGVLDYLIQKFYKDGKYKVIAQKVFKDLFWFVPEDNFLEIGQAFTPTEQYHIVKLNLLADDIMAKIIIGGVEHKLQVMTQPVTPLRMHLVQYASIQFSNRVLPLEKMNYLKAPLNPELIKKFDIDFSKTVVINTSFRSKTRRFIPEELKKICEYINDKGYKPLFVGKTETPDYITDIGYNNLEFDYTIGVDLRDKTSILEALNLISLSKLMLGVDNGIMHLAGLTDVKIVGCYTLASPENRMPIRHNKLGWNVFPIVPDRLKCVHCMDRYQLQNFNFNECFYGHYECVKKLTAKKIINELENHL